MTSIFAFLITIGVLVFGSAAVTCLFRISSDLREIRNKVSERQLDSIDGEKESRNVHLLLALGAVVFFGVVIAFGGFQA